MHLRRFITIVILACLPATLLAELANGDLPAARWYAHVDLVTMRKGEAGKQLYAWLDREVFDELREEMGFDASREADSVTAIASPDGGIMIVVDGNFSQMTADRIVALAALASDFETLDFENTPYFFIGDEQQDADEDNGQDPKSLHEGAYVSVALKNKLLIAQSEQQMQQLLKSKGRIPGNYDSGNALLILSAQQNLVQAGANAAGFGDDLGWDSNVLRNTRQIALLVAEAAGRIAIEGQLIATDANVANSLASIVRGLISLQVFNDDLDPALSDLLQNTSVNVSDMTLTVKLQLDPASVLSVID
ncbi:MAG: hypothetical protein OEW64_14165 [Gammaproteobacteria bacterium]|nr:hypothetical protein [Gammaproteobacteria bacterium]MDH5323330.1 hypothetical protein [Gammaproteobacteria bacterium]